MVIGLIPTLPGGAWEWGHVTCGDWPHSHARGRSLGMRPHDSQALGGAWEWGHMIPRLWEGAWEWGYVSCWWWHCIPLLDGWWVACVTCLCLRVCHKLFSSLTLMLLHLVLTSPATQRFIWSHNLSPQLWDKTQGLPVVRTKLLPTKHLFEVVTNDMKLTPFLCHTQLIIYTVQTHKGLRLGAVLNHNEWAGRCLYMY